MSSAHRPRILSLIALIATITAVAVPTAAVASAGYVVKLTVPNHTPVTCVNWDIKITATKAGKGLSGRVEYYYFTLPGSSSKLEGKQPAGTAQNHYGDFTKGVFKDNVIFPSEAAQGESLVFHAVVKTAAGTKTVTSEVTPKAGTKQCKAT